MNTAAPSRKKLLSLVLTLVFMLTCLPAALAVDLNVDAGFYFKQSRGGTCTLASAAMMLRRRAYFDGLTDWSTVTENSVRSTAWSNGLSHSFTYKEMQVGYGTLPSRKQEKVQTLITLLSPAGNISSGRIPLENSSVSVNRSSCYWYVASDHNFIAAEADGLRLEGMSYPINVRAGKGMALTGTANAALGTTLTNVQLAVLDENDQTVFTAQAAPNTAIFSFKSLDSSIRFGELPAGNYTYMVVVTDSQGDNLCFTSDFTVSDGSASSGVYWSVKDTEGTKLLDSIQEVQDAFANATESTLGWFGGLFQ